MSDLKYEKKKPFLFPNKDKMLEARKAFEENYPELKTTYSEDSDTLFVDVRHSLMLQLHITDFLKKFGGIPRPNEFSGA